MIARKLIDLAQQGVQSARIALSLLREREGRSAGDARADRVPAHDFLDRAWGFAPERPDELT